MKIFEKENIFYNNSWLAPISRWFLTHFIAVYRLLQIFQNFSPFGIAAFTASALLQGIRGKLLQLHALRLAAAAKSAIADFRYNLLRGCMILTRLHNLTCRKFFNLLK